MCLEELAHLQCGQNIGLSPVWTKPFAQPMNTSSNVHRTTLVGCLGKYNLFGSIFFSFPFFIFSFSILQNIFKLLKSHPWELPRQQTRHPTSNPTTTVFMAKFKSMVVISIFFCRLQFLYVIPPQHTYQDIFLLLILHFCAVQNS